MAQRERTTYLKMVEGAVANVQNDGGWVDVKETVGGGADVATSIEILDFLDHIYARSLVLADSVGEFTVELTEKGDGVLFFEKDGTKMSYDKVMEILFD